jgi:putative ABC transport system permease protein
MALGATRRQIVGLVLKEAAALICAGLVIGLAGSLALAQTAASLLFDISPRDPGQLGAAAAALLAAAALGSLLPARRASRLDPMNALRDE